MRTYTQRLSMVTRPSSCTITSRCTLDHADNLRPSSLTRDPVLLPCHARNFARIKVHVVLISTICTRSRNLKTSSFITVRKFIADALHKTDAVSIKVMPKDLIMKASLPRTRFTLERTFNMELTCLNIHSAVFTLRQSISLVKKLTGSWG